MSRHLRLTHLLLSAILLSVLSSSAYSEDTNEDGFTSLSDGASLDGWEGNPKMFRVEDGAIVAGSLEQKIPHNDFLCTEQQFEDFELRLSAKLGGEGENAGIQFRSRRRKGDHEVSGYQCDMGKMGDKNIWGAMYDESRRNRFLVFGEQEGLNKVFKQDDWNEFVIRCQGAKIQIWVNGFQTVDYTEEDVDIARKGIIGLQIHGGPPAEAYYKNLRIKEL